MRALLLLALAVLAAAGCAGDPKDGPPRPKATAEVAPRPALPAALGPDLEKAIAGRPTRPVGVGAQVVTLTGRAEIIGNNGGTVVSNHGAEIVSDNGGGLISDAGGGLLSDAAAGVVSNHTSRLISQTKLRLLDAAPARFALAEAAITFEDAKGQVLLDADGKPLVATTDATGRYALTAALPPGNLVMRIQLFPNDAAGGGELVAMLARALGPRTLDLDTASTLGAAYVLDQYVKGDQATFDKLPAAQADRLRADVAKAVAPRLVAAPSYRVTQSVALAGALRRQDAAVDQTLEDIKALLIGQAVLGDGQVATKVPLASPHAIAVDAAGRLVISEAFTARLRVVGTDGTISTLADVARGQLKQNFSRVRQIVASPDGALDLASEGVIFRIGPDLAVSRVAGDAHLAPANTNLDLPAAEVSMADTSMARGPDGTLYIGERMPAKTSAPPRILTLGADGKVRKLPLDLPGTGVVQGMALAPDGTLYFAYTNYVDGTTTLYKRAPGASGAISQVMGGLEIFYSHGLVLAKDGSLYVAEDLGRRVTAVRPDGSGRRVVAGAGGPADHAVSKPLDLANGPDGTVYIADVGRNQVFALAPDGGWRVVAGTYGDGPVDDLANIPVNGPTGVAVARDGAILIAEVGSHAIKRFDGRALTTIAGGEEGRAGDGGPSAGARFNAPQGLAIGPDGSVYVADASNHLLRRLAPDGTASTVVGQEPASNNNTLARGERVEGRRFALRSQRGVVVGPDGSVYWSAFDDHQVQRLTPDGFVEAVAGRPGSALALPAYDEDGRHPLDAGLLFPAGLAFGVGADAGSLYVAEVGGLRVRRITEPGTPAAKITTVAGLPLPQILADLEGLQRDNNGLPAKEIAIVAPMGLCFDAAGNMYVAEVGSTNGAILGPAFGSADFMSSLPPSAARVRKITPDGLATTVVGPGGKFFTDPKADDALVVPSGLAIDRQGRLVLLDGGANLIRILPAGAY